jgi:hypothetical protein
MPGKRVQFDAETWQQIDLLGRDQMKDFAELADEAFRDLLKKHGRPVDLKDALRRSAGARATVHRLKPGKAKKSRS